jgi:ribonucleoside-diphosphate reductase alpha chain
MKERSIPSMSRTASPFLTPLAVDTWDALFRWREDGRLRDLTIESTWQRVAHALSGGSLSFESELLDAFAEWSLLPDPRVIATAGTSTYRAIEEPSATLNLAAFVCAPRGADATFDRARLASIASLAVRALDNMRPQPDSLRIGALGFSDALESLGYDYGGAAAWGLARDIAQTIWCSAVDTSAGLIRRGAPRIRRDEAWLAHARSLGLDAPAADRITSHGMRHSALTAIASQPALSRLANCVSDALDPVGQSCAALQCGVDGRRREHATGHHRAETAAHHGVAAQLRIRAAMQPWMDEPIAYPVVTRETFDAAAIEQWRKLAHHHGLGALTIEKAAPE